MLQGLTYLYQLSSLVSALLILVPWICWMLMTLHFILRKCKDTCLVILSNSCHFWSIKIVKQLWRKKFLVRFLDKSLNFSSRKVFILILNTCQCKIKLERICCNKFIWRTRTSCNRRIWLHSSLLRRLGEIKHKRWHFSTMCQLLRPIWTL